MEGQRPHAQRQVERPPLPSNLGQCLTAMNQHVRGEDQPGRRNDGQQDATRGRVAEAEADDDMDVEHAVTQDGVRGTHRRGGEEAQLRQLLPPARQTAKRWPRYGCWCARNCCRSSSMTTSSIANPARSAALPGSMSMTRQARSPFSATDSHPAGAGPARIAK